ICAAAFSTTNSTWPPTVPTGSKGYNPTTRTTALPPVLLVSTYQNPEDASLVMPYATPTWLLLVATAAAVPELVPMSPMKMVVGAATKKMLVPSVIGDIGGVMTASGW